MARYLDLRLSSPVPHAMSYFVPHSGVARALELLDASLESLMAEEAYFALLYFYGPAGVGKTHLIDARFAPAIERGFALRRLEICDLDEPSFVGAYEETKGRGGILAVESRQPPSGCGLSSHLGSRLRSACSVALSYPSEEEFLPIFLSLLERYDVRLSKRCVGYMMRRLPLNPSVFASTISELSAISFSRRRPVGLGVLRELLGGA